MKKDYLKPNIKVREIMADSMMLPDSVSGGDVTPPTVNNAKENRIVTDESADNVQTYNVWNE